MNDRCAAAIIEAVGRALTPQELAGIEQRVRDQMRQLARTDPLWRTLSTADRLQRAGEAAQAQLLGEAKLKRERVALQVAAVNARLGEMREYAEQRPGRTLFDGLAEVLRRVDVASKGVIREAMSQLVDLMEAAQPGLLRMTGDPAFARDFVFEVFGQETGNAAAKAGAKAWLEAAEAMRLRFNRSGGDVGKLDYSYLPQGHDMVRALRAGMDAWVGYVMPRLDRSRYVDENGALMDDAAVRSFLEAAYKTISTDGLSKLEPGKIPPGVSALVANRGSQSRQIHFAGPQAYLEYMNEFGSGSVFEGMMGHVRAMGLNIAMVERMGPNAKATFELLHDTARVTGADDVTSLARWRVSTRDLWNSLSGQASQLYAGGQVYATRAGFFQGLRNWMVTTKLQGTLLSAVTDAGTYFATTGYNRVGMYDALRTLIRSFTPGAESTNIANRMGLVSESLAQDMGRWGSEMLRDGWTSRLANTTMRVSLLNAWTDAMRRAAGISVMGALGRLAKTEWSALDEGDRIRLTEQGFTEETWGVLRLATTEDWGGAAMITPEAVRAVPDEAILIGPARDRAVGQREAALAEVAELARRNQQEQGWLVARSERLAALEARLADRLNRFMSSRDATVQAARERLSQQKELLAARVELAAAEADVDAYLLQQQSRNATTAALEALRRGEDAAVSRAFAAGAGAQRAMDAGPAGMTRGLEQADATIGAISEQLDAAAARAGERLDAAGDRVSARRGDIGERLGERRGRARARIEELERSVRRLERDAAADVQAKYEEMTGTVRDAMDEFGAWLSRMQERSARRQAVIDRITRDIPAQQAQLAQRVRDDAVTRLVGMLVDETEYASLAPDIFTRARVESFGQRGTWPGEIARSAFLFKSFPMALISRHWTRASERWAYGEGADRFAYAGAIFVGMTLLGGVSVMLKDMASGRDPQDTADPTFWLRAMAAGGGLSFLGDAMLGMAGSGRQIGGQSSAAAAAGAVAGPLFGTAIELGDLTAGNVAQAIRGDDTDFGAEALRFVRGNTPFVNLWYVRTALDRAIFHDLQEQLSPGYLRRMEQRARENFGQDFWWRPGENLPDRAPDFGAAVGGGR